MEIRGEIRYDGWDGEYVGGQGHLRGVGEEEEGGDEWEPCGR